MSLIAPNRGSEGESNIARIVRLRLRNWMNFQQAELVLGRRAFLIGPNASGKSNLLDAIKFLHDLVAVGGGFVNAIRKRNGVSQMRCLAARRSPAIEIDIHFESANKETSWRYELTFSQDNRSRPYIKSEVVEKDGVVLLQRPLSEDDDDPERLTQTYLEQVHANQGFREIANFLVSITYLHLVPQLVREPDRSVGRARDPYGGDLLDRVAETMPRVRDSRLRKIREALSVAVPQLSELELTRDTRGVPHLRGRYEHWRPHGSWQTEDQFSDGTLRLFGLLWALLDGDGPLLLEEPELSLHPEVVRRLPSMFERIQRRKPHRQIFVSTHSEFLLSDEGVGLDEVFVLAPDPEGTRVSALSNDKEGIALAKGGVPLGEIAMTRTRPSEAEQLDLFSG